MALGGLLLLAACGESGPNDELGAGPETTTRALSTTTTPPLTEPTAAPGLEFPPPVTVRYFDESVALQAWAYCYRSGRVDGSPPPNRRMWAALRRL